MVQHADLAHTSISGAVITQDDGSTVGTASVLNFANGTTTFSNGTATVNLNSGGGISGLIVQDDGATVGTATVLNFTNGTASFSGGTATVNQVPIVTAARGTRTTNQTIGTGAWTAIELNAADTFDTASIHDPAGADPEQFVPPVTGYYQVNARAQFSAEATGDRYISIYVAGAQYSQSIRQQANSTIGNFLFIAEVCFLTATTDYVEVRVFQDSGGNRTVSSASLSIALIGI